MNIETVKQEYMTMYDSLKRKIEDELKKFTYSTFFVDSQSFGIVDNIIKTDVSALFERSKLISASNDDDKNTYRENDSRIKDMIANLKFLMINNYNARLDYIRQVRDETLNEVSSDVELTARIRDINIPDNVNSNGINYRTNISKRVGTFVDSVAILNNISSIQQEYNEKVHKLVEEKRQEEDRKNNIRLSIISDISTFENIVNDFENGVKTSLLMDEVRKEYIKISNFGRVAREKVNDAKNEGILSEIEWNNYYHKLVADDDKLFRIKNSIPINMEDIHDKKITEYKKLKYDLYMLDGEILNYIDTVMGMFNDDNVDLDMFIDDYMDVGKRLNAIRFDADNKYREKIIDKQLYDNLINYFSRCSGHFDELGSKIKKIDDKKIDETVVKEPKIDPSKNISALEKLIKHFEDLINNDFWDAWKRRRIEDLFKYYDNKVQEVYGMIDVNDGKSAELIIRLDVLKAKLEQLHNHENIIKYQNTKIDNLRIPEINKNNFSEFKVKAVESAKDFYEKHKDAPLNVLGLIKLSFIHPTIIPALVHGMIVEKLPIRDKLFEMFPDKFRKDGDKVYMANGMEVNSKTAVSSMLKAIADSDVSNPKIVTNMVQGVRNVIDKAKKKAEKVSKNVKAVFTNEESNEYSDYIRKLASQYLLTNMNLEEFCNENNISKEDKYNLGSFIDEKYYWDFANEYLNGDETDYAKFVDDKHLTQEDSSRVVEIIDQIYYNNLISEYTNSGMSFDEFCEEKAKGSSRFSKEQFANLLDAKTRTRGAR
ncbi:MAG: hypothetical protein SOZ11_01730 [Bacilli bacterium]|nr:hypothetical protein [Bacilli bacterium]